MTPEDELHTYVYTHIDMHIYALTCKHTHTHILTLTIRPTRKS